MWTGVEDESSTGRGSNLSDSRKLEALEVITGRDFESAYGSNPVYQAGQYIEQAFNKLVEMYYAELERQTTYTELYQHLYSNMDIDEQGNIYYETQEVIDILMENFEDNQKEGRELIFQFFNNVQNTGFMRLINEEELCDQLAIFGTDVMQKIEYAGDDVILGTSGNDLLVAGMGIDTVHGGDGNDTYVFNLGDGQDTILDGYGTDKLVFGEGIKEDDIRVWRTDRDLYLTNMESGDKIMVKDFFYNGVYFVEEVEFADGTKWDCETIKDKGRYYYGTDGNDTIHASDNYYYAQVRED